MVRSFGNSRSEIWYKKMLWIAFGLVFLIVIGSCSILKMPPPGTTKTRNPKVYIDQTEVLNKDWTEYLSYLKNTYGINSTKYLNALPDSTIWNSLYDGSSIKRYHTEASNFPIVGITYKQAKRFCKWRSIRVSKLKKYRKNNLSVKYKLPTPEEWIEVYNNLKRKMNLRTLNDTLIAEKRKSNKIYHFQDNVSEMTSEKGIAMGLNWKKIKNFHRKLKSISIDTIKYNGAKSYLGFRCVAYIKSK